MNRNRPRRSLMPAMTSRCRNMSGDSEVFESRTTIEIIECWIIVVILLALHECFVLLAVRLLGLLALASAASICCCMTRDRKVRDSPLESSVAARPAIVEYATHRWHGNARMWYLLTSRSRILCFARCARAPRVFASLAVRLLALVRTQAPRARERSEYLLLHDPRS